MSFPTDSVSLSLGQRTLEIEYRWAGSHHAANTLVLLHEGLGSVAMWKGFEDQLAAACNARVLVYSRPGYGRSTPRPPSEVWSPDFMHVQARAVLPALLDALGVAQPVDLVGHSDGASIALIAAAHQPDRYGRLVVIAPHTHVEDICISAIEASRVAYAQGTLKSALARYHRDPDSAYFGWSEAWLAPAFRDWDLRDLVAQLDHPILAIQGEGDAYGTMEQVLGIARLAPQARVLQLANCGHSPHRDQPTQVLAAITDFLGGSAP